jgi:hypothetical protein
MEISSRITSTVSAMSRFTITPHIVGNLDHDGAISNDDRRQWGNPVVIMDGYHDPA